jgi:predicted metal-dependent phosphoesterase TrpH
MSGYDLHTHSICSDGTNTIAENIELAVERGLEGIGITDHDTTEGHAEAFAHAEGTGLTVVAGLELSAEFGDASLHVLGYWVEPAHEGLQEELRRLSDSRFRRGEMMVEKVRDMGYDLSFERVKEIAGGQVIARPHIAQAMAEAGIVQTEKEAFDGFISDDGPAYVPKHALDPIGALHLIVEADGVCVLAHPGMWRGADSVPEDLIEEMADAGMVGLEVDHPDHTPEQRSFYRTLCDRLDLVPTGASDCHGARYGYRLGCETTPLDRVSALQAGRHG